MKQFVVALFLLSLLSFSFAAACEPGYSDFISVRALDALLRPMQGVAINITYQKDFTTGKGYFTTPTQYTNENGTISAVLANREQLATKVDCNIDIHALFSGKSITKKVIANAHPNPVDITFDAYRLTVQVLNENNKPISGATIIVNNTEKRADASGLAFFTVLKGSNRVFASFEEGKTERIISINNDSFISLSVGSYPLRVVVEDENGNPLSGVKITVADKESFTNDSGVSEFTKLFGREQDVTAELSGNRKTETIDLSLEHEVKFIFDVTPPQVKLSKIDQQGQNLQFSILVEDTGLQPSGISAGGVTLKYSINNGELEKASLFLRSGKEYFSEIKKPAAGSIVSFIIDATDKDGNKKTLEGKVTIESPSSPPTNNTAPPPPPPPTPGNLPLVEIVVGILILAVVIYLVSRLRKGVEE